MKAGRFSWKTFETFRAQHGITSATLKLIAIISMLIDHTGATFVARLRYLPSVNADPQMAAFISQLYYYMRRIGRLAFPIFCFTLIEGYFHTHNIRKYIGRMFLFALISEFPFDFALHHSQPFMNKQNVYWTLLIGLLVIWAVDDIFAGRYAIQLMLLINAMLFAQFLKTDYNIHGIFLIETLYILHQAAPGKGKPSAKAISGENTARGTAAPVSLQQTSSADTDGSSSARLAGQEPAPLSPWASFRSSTEMRLWQSACGAAYVYFYEWWPTPFSFLLTFLYNGKKGRPLKYFFYWFYPAHLMILGILTWVVLPQFM